MSMRTRFNPFLSTARVYRVAGHHNQPGRRRVRKPPPAMTAVVLALGIVCAWPLGAQEPAAEEQPAPAATRDEVQREADEAVAAVRSYSTAQRQAAEQRAREAVERMRARAATLQEDVTTTRQRLDEDARASRERLLEGARGKLELAQRRSAELDAAGEAEWLRARERFLDSYRALAEDVQRMVGWATPGQPLPPQDSGEDEVSAEDADNDRW